MGLYLIDYQVLECFLSLLIPFVISGIHHLLHLGPTCVSLGVVMSWELCPAP